MSKLDKEYQELADQINDKIKEAAKAMYEANRMATEANVSLTYN